MFRTAARGLINNKNKNESKVKKLTRTTWGRIETRNYSLKRG